MPHYLNVAVPTPLRQLFDYLPPENVASVAPGTRVAVPYGARTLVGIVVSISETSPWPTEKLKRVEAVLDERPVVSADILALCRWASDYYHHPIGEVLHTALPVQLRKAAPLPPSEERVWAHTTEGKGLPHDGLKRSKRQQQLHQLLLAHRFMSREQILAHDISPAVIKGMAGKGLIHQVPPPEPAAQTILAQAAQAPTPEQEAALGTLRYHQYGSYLLEGTTGSGKTEVYLQAIARVLNEGKQALVLVPEIGLTPQTLARFRARFAVPVVALHSNMAATERAAAWLQAGSGQARVVIGTRLAVFTPLARPGIIIIDEEHDTSFKQQDGLRYSARDVAVVRAHKAQIPLLLGSATPSLESLNNAISGRYEHLRLTQRAGAARAPALLPVDMRKEQKDGAFALHTLEQIRTTLGRGEQVLVFINRRGFAPALLCEQCGWVANCNACDARLTLHTHPRHLRCHHCDAQHPVPPRCPACNNPQLSGVGQGTARVEETLAARFANYEVMRVDQDSMQRKNAMAELTEKLHTGEPCILVGTQMLAKGHHFPKVTLVVLLDVDQALFSGDFRALERLGQQVVQVAGRAGREALPGTVILQSYQADHPLLTLLLEQGYHCYARTLLQERKQARLPPCWHMAVLRAECKRPESAVELLKLAERSLRQALPMGPDNQLLGPIPALLERRADRYRYLLQITCANRGKLQQALTHTIATLSTHALARRVRWSLDVDPADVA